LLLLLLLQGNWSHVLDVKPPPRIESPEEQTLTLAAAAAAAAGQLEQCAGCEAAAAHCAALQVMCMATT
jgi:hypothetical protein